MNSEILIAFIGAASATATGLFTHFFTKRQSRAATTSVEIDNVRKSNEMLSERVTELNDETKSLRKELGRMGLQIKHLRRAIERIPLCTHAAECPVSRQLQELPSDELDADLPSSTDLLAGTPERSQLTAQRQQPGSFTVESSME